MAAIREAIQKEVPSKPKANTKAAEEAYSLVKMAGLVDETVAPAMKL
jgi:hypothetical protein